MTTPPLNDQNVAWFGIEPSFETLATLQPLIIEAGSFQPDFSPEMLKDNDGSARLYDAQTPIEGLSKGGAKFQTKMRPHAAQITAAAPVAPHPAQIQLLEMVMGGLQVGAGSALSTGTTSSVTVTSAAGFAIGQVFGIKSASDVHVALITNIVGNVITFWPELPVAVTAGTALNAYCAFATEHNEKTGSFQSAFANDANAQYAFSGCIGKVGLKTDLGQVMMLDFDLMASKTERGALGLSAAVQTQAMGAGGLAVKNALCILQPAATVTRTGRDFIEIASEFDPMTKHLDSHRGENGRRGAARLGGREATKVKITLPYDASLDTAWRAGTEYRLLYAVPQGTGAAKRFCGIAMPKLVILEAPKDTNRGGERVHELTLGAKIDRTAAADSIAGAPVQYFTI
jgi:hypothetical protein